MHILKALFLLCWLPLGLYAQTAEDIIREADKKARGISSYAVIQIDIIRPTWTRSMEMKSWSKGDKLGLTLISAPSKDKGTVFLKRDKEIWNWIPSIERNVKLPPSIMMQSWMGTDFTNDDLVKQSSLVTDYTHKLIKEETIEGRACYLVELLPKPDAPVVWGKIMMWIDKTEFMQMKVAFYDEDAYLISYMLGKEVKMIGGKMLPTVLEMVPVEEEGHKTVMRYSELEFDLEISDSFFSTQNMKKVR